MGVSQKGLRDWIIQRITAIVLAVYSIFMLVFFIVHPSLDYAAWQGLFTSVLMQVATMIVLLALVWHAWIGIWTVCTDYLKSFALRLFVEAMVLLLLFACFFWGFYILWSV